ncbi:MAG: chromosome segregation protein ScpA [Verrucomicrobiales bacterium]|nr:chromosome segregation protein ScpA [Verrucomicrobiales bacterium]
MAEYKVQFEIFEGPLDLLLYLVKKQEVDIYEVNLTYIAEEFIQYIEMMRKFDLEIAGEFLVMAATLMYIKSKELLPVDKQVEVDDEEDEDDPRWELIRQLVEYRKFKDAASDFKQRELAQEDIFVRNPTKPDFKVESVKLKLSVFDLLGAVDKILERIDAQEDREIFADRWTVSEKIEQIRSTIEKKDRVMFTELFEDAMSRSEVVATFLALLELTKLKMIVVEQGAEFSDIEICKAPAGHGIIREEGELPLDDACNEPVVSEYDAPTGEQE